MGVVTGKRKDGMEVVQLMMKNNRAYFKATMPSVSV